MAEIPEHLLKRAQQRRAELAGEDNAGEEASTPANADAGASDPVATEGASSPAPADSGASLEIPELTGIAATVPRHLIERSYTRRAVLEGKTVAAPSAGGGAPAATAAAAPAAPTMTGPGGNTQRLLTVVKSGSIQQTKAEAQDKVHTWPHLLSIEFGAMVIVTCGLFIFSAFVRAPLLGLADINQTPNPSKAPWYFLGLQELLTMFHPMVAGVTIPGVALVILALTPYYDKNLSNKPENRKYAFAMMTIFLIFWAVLVIIGSFFRGQGFNFVFPMKDGVFFEL